jgi:hypothetical protein
MPYLKEDNRFVLFVGFDEGEENNLSTVVESEGYYYDRVGIGLKAKPSSLLWGEGPADAFDAIEVLMA